MADALGGALLTVDLHNHPFEAMGVRSVAEIEPEHVIRLAEAARRNDVDLLGITEHGGWAWGTRAVELTAGLDLGLVLLPGQEDWYYPLEVVEVQLPSGRVFRFLAHPGAPAPFEPVFHRVLPGIHGIEVNNENHQWHMDRESLLSLAEDHGLLPMSSSDAHDLAQLGARAMKCTLEDLEAAAAAKVLDGFTLAGALR